MYLQHHCQLCYDDLGSTAGLFSYAWFGEFRVILNLRNHVAAYYIYHISRTLIVFIWYNSLLWFIIWKIVYTLIIYAMININMEAGRNYCNSNIELMDPYSIELWNWLSIMALSSSLLSDLIKYETSIWLLLLKVSIHVYLIAILRYPVIIFISWHGKENMLQTWKINFINTKYSFEHVCFVALNHIIKTLKTLILLITKFF